MATLQEQARALGDPTRHSIFRYLATSEDPVGVAELTDHLGLNHNAIRQHLAKLVDAELVLEGKAAPNGPGRPRLVYTIDPAGESRWGSTGPYERLSLLLAEIIRSGDTPFEVGRRAGHAQRRAGGDAGALDDVDVAVAQLRDAMAREGFDPQVRARGDSTDILLRNCPFETTALNDPDTVCALHLGMAEGLVEGQDSVGVEELVAKDPRRANCRLKLRIDRPDRP